MLNPEICWVANTRTIWTWGDMSSDRASEQYPTVTVCDSRVTRLQAPAEGEECHFCDKTKDEEDAEMISRLDA
jgi:hypothetical protein